MAARFRWLVHFAQQISGPRNARAERKLIQTLGTSLCEVVLRREASGEIVDLRHPEVANLPFRGEDDQKSPAEKLALVRSTIHTLLTQHLSKGERRPAARILLRLTANEDGYISRQYEADDTRDAAAYVVLLELEQFGHRLRRCAATKCHRLFVRERRQRYCSVTCRNRATFQRWYRRHKATPKHKKPHAAHTLRMMRRRRKVPTRRVRSV